MTVLPIIPENWLPDGSKKIKYSYDPLNRITSKTVDTSVPFVNSYEYKDSERGEDYTTGAFFLDQNRFSVSF